jgi:hypothetical protein
MQIYALNIDQGLRAVTTSLACTCDALY